MSAPIVMPNGVGIHQPTHLLDASGQVPSALQRHFSGIKPAWWISADHSQSVAVVAPDFVPVYHVEHR